MLLRDCRKQEVRPLRVIFVALGEEGLKCGEAFDGKLVVKPSIQRLSEVLGRLLLARRLRLP